MSEEEINKKMQDFIEKIEQIVSTNIHLLKDNEILKINNIDETTLTDFVSFCLEIKNLYIKEKEKNEKQGKIINSIQTIDNYCIKEKYISKDKIRNDLEVCKKVYEQEMKPYMIEIKKNVRVLNITGLSKKEKEELVNKRNCLLTQIRTYEMLLEE